MKLCIVTHILSFTDGQGRVNAEVVAASNGFRVHVIASKVDETLLQQPNLFWHKVVAPRWLPSSLLKYQWFAMVAFLKVNRLVGIDILQLNGAIVYRYDADVNVANFVHSDWIKSAHHPIRGAFTCSAIYQSLYTRLNAAWERRAFRKSRCVVAVSEQVRDSLVRYANVPPDKIRVIPPGVDSGQFRPLQLDEKNLLREELRVGADAFILMFVGDIRSNRKNLDLVLESLRQLPSRVFLAIIGDTERSPYPAMASVMGVTKRVRFLGRRTTDLPALLRGASAFVFPSHYDPFALVVTEAMASGLPTITTPSVGASSLIENGRNGFVISTSADLAGLVQAVEKLAGDPQLCEALSLAARATAEKYSWATMVGGYLALYEEIMGEKRRSGEIARSEENCVST